MKSFAHVFSKHFKDLPNMKVCSLKTVPIKEKGFIYFKTFVVDWKYYIDLWWKMLHIPIKCLCDLNLIQEIFALTYIKLLVSSVGAFLFLVTVDSTE